ncbi:hypothetical protein BJX63DRAFT_396224 [Aspergillus granulosus]|uniref:1-alkyl-2-acetylglycerophosphocholine esterase n=1 Tax=Aspergillus granulosus TaxID=176169 RepID=A0ABR4HAX9_9EURO
MTRTDPYDSRGGKTLYMVTTFAPVNCGSIPPTSYIPNATARYEDDSFSGYFQERFESLRIQARRQQPPPFSLYGDYPVVLFSPALGTSRLMYTLLLQDIASNGFFVVSVDHPYDANIVEYPDGCMILGILGNISTEADFVSAMNVRVKDMLFLLDQMHNNKVIRDIFPLSQGNSRLLSLDRVTIFGHSLGGATAAQTILVDNRFVGGINLDGALWGLSWTKGCQVHSCYSVTQTTHRQQSPAGQNFGHIYEDGNLSYNSHSLYTILFLTFQCLSML